MQDLDKNIDTLKIDLFSGNIELVVHAINRVKLSSHFELIDSLFDLYITTQKQEIKNHLFSFFIDIKDKRFVDKLVESIKKPKFTGITTELFSICWQTGLDFSEHIEFFLEKLIAGNDEQAIECFSVIESSIDEIDEDQRKNLVLIFKSKELDFEGVKKGLSQELIYMVE